MRVLIVDDEPRLTKTLSLGLRAEGWVVVAVDNGVDAVHHAVEDDFDVIVLDIMLPGMSGYEVLRRIRAEQVWTPVLMLTAKDGEFDETDALDLGADDYLTKPFSMRELVARVRVLLRRVDRATVDQPVSVGEYRIDLAERRVHQGDIEIHLTRTEFDLLAFLAGRPRIAVTRETLLEHVWGWGSGAETRTVDSHVKALRRKLGAELIRTVHGVGYALEVPR